MMGLGVPEILIILVIVLIIFGPKKLPDIGRAFGKSISEFKTATRDKGSDSEEADKTA